MDQSLASLSFASSNGHGLAAGKLRDKVAIVLGASKGLGRAIAVGYAREGARIVAVARTAILLEEVTSEIVSAGGFCRPVCADVRDGDSVRDLAHCVADDFGRIDVLVHAVGGGLAAEGLEVPLLRNRLDRSPSGIPFWEIDEEHFDSCVARDLRSVFLCCRYFVPMMVARRSGSIVVLGSYSGIMGNRGWSDAAYQATKGGVHALVAAMAREVGPHNIAANVLLPGLTLTAMTRAYAPLRQRASGTPEDAVPAAIFLALQDAESFTGRFVETSTPPRLPSATMPIAQLLSGAFAQDRRQAPGEEPVPVAATSALPVSAVSQVVQERASSVGWGHVGRALQHSHFLLFFVGQALSLPGTWLQRVAIAWLAYQMTGSALVLGLVEFAAQFPVLIGGPFAGVVADRWDRRRLLQSTQIIAMVQAGTLAVLVLGGWAEVWHFVALSLVTGIVSPFDQTARQSLMLPLVDNQRADLASAVGLNSTMQTSARTLGPAAAGLLLAVAGPGVCFVANCFSFLPLIGALSLMRFKARSAGDENPVQRMAFLPSLTSGLRVPAARDVLALLAIGSLFGIPFMVLTPIFAQEVFAGGPEALGFLLTASGLGSLTGALYLAGRKETGGLLGLTVMAAAIFGIGLMGFGLANVFWLALLFLALTGFGMMVLVGAANTFLQNAAGDENRGRVLSWYTMALNGPAPLGSLGVGVLASAIGAPTAVMIAGAACLFGALGIHVRRLASLRLAARRARLAQ